MGLVLADYADRPDQGVHRSRPRCRQARVRCDDGDEKDRHRRHRAGAPRLKWLPAFAGTTDDARPRVLLSGADQGTYLAAWRRMSGGERSHVGARRSFKMTRRNLERVLWPGLALIVMAGVILLSLQAYEALVARTELTALARTVSAFVLIVTGFGRGGYAFRVALRAAEARRRAVDAQSLTEENSAVFVGAVTENAIYTLDPLGHITSWNAGAARIKGYSAQEIIGQHFSRFYTEQDRASGLPQKAQIGRASCRERV